MLFAITLFAIIGAPIIAVLLWLLCIRPYCRRNGKGYTPGANAGVTFWVDWQEAKDLSKANGDEGIIIICSIVFWLQITALVGFGLVIFTS